MIKERDRLLLLLTQSIMTGKFDFSKGNNLANLCEAFLLNFENLFFSTKEPHYDTVIGTGLYGPPTDVIFGGTYLHPHETYLKVIKILEKSLPFLYYYFEHYAINKKVVVLALMKKVKMFDEKLFENFFSHIWEEGKKVNAFLDVTSFENFIISSLSTLNPITNQE